MVIVLVPKHVVNTSQRRHCIVCLFHNRNPLSNYTLVAKQSVSVIKVS